jgi:hypothetical protein
MGRLLCSPRRTDLIRDIAGKVSLSTSLMEAVAAFFAVTSAGVYCLPFCGR